MAWHSQNKTVRQFSKSNCEKLAFSCTVMVGELDLSLKHSVVIMIIVMSFDLTFKSIYTFRKFRTLVCQTDLSVGLKATCEVFFKKFKH